MTWIELTAQRRPPTLPPGVTPPENANDWYRIENSADDLDTTDIYVYDSIGGWFGVYADEFIRDLKGVATKNITLRLNSPGGSVFDGVAIANAIRSHPANVTVYVDGLAASIASVIALAGNKLVMMPQTSFMIHDASGGCYGNAAEMETMRDLLDKQSDNIASAYAAAAGGTVQEWRDLMKAETWYTADEAVKAGLADEVMEIPKKGDDGTSAAAESASVYARMQATYDLSAFKYAGREAAPAPTAHAPGGIVNMAEEPVAALADGESVIRLSIKDALLTALVDEHVVEMMRSAIKAAMPPPPEEEVEDAAAEPEVEDAAEEVEDAAEEVEDETVEEPEAAADPPEPEDAAKKKLPPWLKEDDDEKSDDDDSKKSTKNSADDWGQLIAGLATPSPSADDVFNTLKEGW